MAMELLQFNPGEISLTVPSLKPDETQNIIDEAAGYAHAFYNEDERRLKGMREGVEYDVSQQFPLLTRRVSMHVTREGRGLLVFRGLELVRNVAGTFGMPYDPRMGEATIPGDFALWPITRRSETHRGALDLTGVVFHRDRDIQVPALTLPQAPSINPLMAAVR